MMGPMGVQQQLGYAVPRANGLQRLTQRFASTRPGAWTFAKTAHHLDRLVLRATKGRSTLAAMVAGIPVVMVTTTGRRSGEGRTMPLLGVPIGDDLALLGTNFGQAALPAWYLNFGADPHGEVAYRDRTVAVTAREATEEEREEVMRTAAAIYPGYDRYRERITGRVIPVLVLESRRPSSST